MSAQEIVKPLLFTGNTTVVAPPTPDTKYAFGPGDFAGLYRGADCAVTGMIATATGGTTPSVKVQSVTDNYQDTLHTLAGLTTKGDIWPDGCGDSGANNPAYFAADAGLASNKSYVVATIDSVNPNILDIYNVKGTVTNPILTKVQTWNIGPYVYPIAALDLNGDGLADLVVGFAGANPPSRLRKNSI